MFNEGGSRRDAEGDRLYDISCNTAEIEPAASDVAACPCTADGMNAMPLLCDGLDERSGVFRVARCAGGMGDTTVCDLDELGDGAGTTAVRSGDE